MKVLHVISSLDPASGGPALIASYLAGTQAKLGVEAAVATIWWSAGAERSTRMLENLALPLCVHRLPEPKNVWERLTHRQVGAQLAPLIAASDVVHLHSVWDPILLVAAGECRRRHRPYVVLLNGMLDPWSLAQRRWKKQIALTLAYRRMLNGAAFLHLGNRDERDLIAPLRLQSRGVIVPNGVNPEALTTLPAPGAFRAKHPAIGSRPYALFLSRLHYKKGLDYLAQAFALVAARHAEVQLVVAGPDEGARESFARAIADKGLSRRVHMVGPLYGVDKYAALVDATCFVLPSRQEGFSMAITEALGCGVPCVISEGCHFPEVADAGAGFVLPLQPERFAQALQQLLADPARARAMGQAGRQMVMQRYTWPAIVTQLQQAYAQALGQA